MATSESFGTDPALWIFASLTAGSSHIVTATSRLETILRANKVPFKAVDISVNDKARSLWGRRAGKDATGRLRKVPGLVQDGMVLGDLVEVEEWNEYGELREHIKIYYDEHTIPPISQAPKEPPTQKPATASTTAGASTSAPTAPPAAATGAVPAAKPQPHHPYQVNLPIRSIADEAAKKAKELRLQSLRDKVYGKGKTGPEGEDSPQGAKHADDTKETKEDVESNEKKAKGTKETDDNSTLSSVSTSQKLPSPATSPVSATTTTQTTPTRMDSVVLESASQEEIEAVERAQAISEEPEAEAKAEKEEEEAINAATRSISGDARGEDITASSTPDKKDKGADVDSSDP